MEEKIPMAIAVFETDSNEETINTILIKARWSPLYTKAYMGSHWQSPQQVADYVREYKQYVYHIFGFKNKVWVHHYPETLAKLLVENHISFTITYLSCAPKKKKGYFATIFRALLAH